MMVIKKIIITKIDNTQRLRKKYNSPLIQSNLQNNLMSQNDYNNVSGVKEPSCIASSSRGRNNDFKDNVQTQISSIPVNLNTSKTTYQYNDQENNEAENNYITGGEPQYNMYNQNDMYSQNEVEIGGRYGVRDIENNVPDMVYKKNLESRPNSRFFHIRKENIINSNNIDEYQEPQNEEGYYDKSQNTINELYDEQDDKERYNDNYIQDDQDNDDRLNNFNNVYPRKKNLLIRREFQNQSQKDVNAGDVFILRGQNIVQSQQDSLSGENIARSRTGEIINSLVNPSVNKNKSERSKKRVGQYDISLPNSKNKRSGSAPKNDYLEKDNINNNKLDNDIRSKYPRLNNMNTFQNGESINWRLKNQREYAELNPIYGNDIYRKENKYIKRSDENQDEPLYDYNLINNNRGYVDFLMRYQEIVGTLDLLIGYFEKTGGAESNISENLESRIKPTKNDKRLVMCKDFYAYMIMLNDIAKVHFTMSTINIYRPLQIRFMDKILSLYDYIMSSLTYGLKEPNMMQYKFLTKSQEGNFGLAPSKGKKKNNRNNEIIIKNIEKKERENDIEKNDNEENKEGVNLERNAGQSKLDINNNFSLHSNEERNNYGENEGQMNDNVYSQEDINRESINQEDINQEKEGYAGSADGNLILNDNKNTNEVNFQSRNCHLQENLANLTEELDDEEKKRYKRHYYQIE